ncbi:MAG: PfkB family carbohydrate kinase [Gammaproteobacteria bacterium]
MSGRLIVVGAINTDLVIVAPHLPAPGETVVGGGLQTFGGGKGANAAVAAARAGASVALIGAVGADDNGTSAVAELRADGVATRDVAVLDTVPTGAALIVVDQNGENQIAIGPGANGAVTPQHVRHALARAMPESNTTVLVSTEIPYDAVAAAVETAAAAGARCILNPAPVIAGLVELLSFEPILTPNAIELRELARELCEASPGATAPEDVRECLALIGERTRAPVIVTLGGEGCAVRLPDGTVSEIPAPMTTDVVDTTGAGDTFNGVLATRLAAGDDIMLAAKTAVAAASLSVTAAGARSGMPTADTIVSAVSRAPA